MRGIIFTMTKKELLSRSTKAVCGITERQIVVPKSKHWATAQAIRKKGWYVVGDDVVPGGRKRKNVTLWFTTSPGL